MTVADRVEWGHHFVWKAELGCWSSTSGTRQVLVIPPEQGSDLWRVLVPSTDQDQHFTGKDAEQRAFCVAECYTRQESAHS